MQPEQTDLSQVLSDDSVLSFLTNHPEFFVNNQEILPRLRIPHASGNAVSLIEKQVSVLRNKCGTLENSLRDLIAVARENENLHQRLHVLIQEVISANNLEQIVALTRSSLCENFNADDVRMLLLASKPKPAPRKKAAKPAAIVDKDTAKPAAKPKAKPRVRKTKAIEGLQIIAHDSQQMELFAELFDTRETVCGLPSAEQLSCFVGDDIANIASAALIPLYHEKRLGMVMLTSKDESRFTSGKGVMFLNQLGELLGRRLHTYGAIAPMAAK